jgi:hypothetical protein
MSFGNEEVSFFSVWSCFFFLPYVIGKNLQYNVNILCQEEHLYFFTINMMASYRSSIDPI